MPGKGLPEERATACKSPLVSWPPMPSVGAGCLCWTPGTKRCARHLCPCQFPSLHFPGSLFNQREQNIVKAFDHIGWLSRART